ncbi:MAG: hypothetical protein ACLP05_02025 [Candidatus Kryptoniota bacterium]
MDYLLKVSSTDVERIVRRDYPSELYESVVEALKQFEGDSESWGIYRVRLAGLKVADGDLEKLKTTIQNANVDFRDVLTEAEYPTVFHQGFPADAIGDSARQKIIEDDWQQYLSWFYRA